MSAKTEMVLINQKHWDFISKHHTESPYYPINEIKNGKSSISKIEADDLGPVAELVGAHLQCGLGLDTISLSRMGAKMTGFDISTTAVSEASKLSADCNQNINYVEANIYDIDSSYHNKFDLVYTSHGVLRWIPDLDKWAETINSLLKPGGTFYIFEIHPMVFRLNGYENSQLTVSGDYCNPKIMFKKLTKSHALDFISGDSTNVAHIDWPLHSIIQSILNSGLQITRFREFPGCSYNSKELFPEKEDNLWYPVNRAYPIPLSFSIRASKHF